MFCFVGREAFVDTSYLLIHFILLKLEEKQNRTSNIVFPEVFVLFCFTSTDELLFCCGLDHSIESGNLVFPFAPLIYLTSLASYLLSKHPFYPSFLIIQICSSEERSGLQI